MGHVHLHVNFIPAAEQFYRDVLGFEVMARYGAGASFVAAGGYHHHLGLNTWAGIGAPHPPNDAARMLWYEIVLPDTAVLDTLVRRIKAAGLSVTERENGRTLTDPSGNGILLTTPNF
jgi:catechol 2,3-dioxygenase